MITLKKRVRAHLHMYASYIHPYLYLLYTAYICYIECRPDGAFESQGVVGIRHGFLLQAKEFAKLLARHSRQLKLRFK
jgi:hypothetical protein